ncbi:hypothetical protein SAMD00019534_118150 [Acytostelium subglobosum LB1]|uniref:hypothetical protein n=1 Tax=Acytostelium subglobosum LB1 TaxID=1410327 RepID=UPI0006448EEA|nr:hypothetical protein SAMD00019534_118150 [Acytostelium subglobosum LB1]GAM28639.1 hypothetical protein SAMD00019534_118150 [Acytostelium subglobosum LB1]|eukprot:XP_012748417.1 hypothetical protein SAMD00019534_118150 [Acytostelium subglobosum LB1]
MNAASVDDLSYFPRHAAELIHQDEVHRHLLESLSKQNKDITSFFGELHIYLQVEEHKVKKPFTEAVVRCHETLISIRNELVSIKEFLQSAMEISVMEPLSQLQQQQLQQQNSPGNGEDIDSFEALPGSLLESFKGVNLSEEAVLQFDVSTTLARVQQHIEEVRFKEPKHQINKLNVRINDERTKEIKQMISQLFELSQAESDIAQTTKSQLSIFSTGQSGSFMFDVETGKWSSLSEDREKRSYMVNSVIHARGYVYVFGGDTKLNTYSRFSVKHQRWDLLGTIINEEGGSGISVCYDGVRFAYLIGGQMNGLLTRIDQMDLETHEFARLGNLPVPIRFAYSFYHDRILYVVGGMGNRVDDGDQHSIFKFDPVSRSTTFLLDGTFEFNHELVSCCFDGREFLYLLDVESNFFRFSIQTKARTVLPRPTLKNNPQRKYKCQMLMLKSKLIYFIGGREHNNFTFNIDLNQWLPLGDNDNVDRRWCGLTTVIKTG